MKSKSLFRYLLAAGFPGAILMAATTSHAGLQVPYVPDASTLHLWHFDDSTANQGTAEFVTVTDAVATASLTLTNYGMGATSTGAEPRTPPYTNIFLVNQAATANLNNCLNILPGGGAAGKAYAWCGTTNNIGGYFADTLSFRNPDSGAFTFEALLYIQGPVFSTSIGNEWEIFCADSQGESGGRSWQFRMQPGAAPSLNINFITQTGGTLSPNVSPPLPNSGINALSVSNWYHVAVTYTGNTPTNADTPCVLTFYWTFFDPYRTNASVLAAYTNSAWGTLGGGPIPAVGGSARRNNGVGNAGAFEGLIDEVRVSDVARSAGEMAFVSGGPQNPPSFTAQPPASTLVGYGKSLTLPTLVSGSLPLAYQWQATNSVGGWTNVPGQVDNSLLVDSVTFGNQGSFRLVVTNSSGAATSQVAQVTVGAAFSELFNTGIDTNGVYDATNLPNNPDPHYLLYRSADVNSLGPNALVWDMFTYPIAANGGFFANPDGSSQWIGPLANSYTSPGGQYIYRTTFLLDSVDLTKPVALNGTWWTGNTGTNIYLNGQPLGITGLTNQQNTGSPFTITSGFKAGLNVLDFHVPMLNPGGTYQESALRVAIAGIGQALPAGIPVISNQPANVTVRDGGKASFSVVALGRPPLSYQWWADAALLSDATNRTLSFNPASSGAQGSSFFVVIRNDSGSVTSSVAALTLTTNRPPVPPTLSLATYANNPANASIADLVYGTTDADGDPVSFFTYNGNSTNGGTIVQNAILLTYTPAIDAVGADQFDYTVTDQIDYPVGYVNITVMPLLAPTLNATVVSGSNLTLSGSGGSAGGSYRLLSSTNVETPLAEWTVESAGVFDGGGGFSATVGISSEPQRYFTVVVP